MNPGGAHDLEEAMIWRKPRVVEVSLALEINAYACAEIG